MHSDGKVRWSQAIACVAFAATISGAPLARAGGLEDTVGGAIGLGRSAYFARVNDFMAVLQNPANLSVVPSNELGGEIRVPILTSCFDRQFDPNMAAKYKKDENGNIVESFDQVCGSGLMPTGNVGFVSSYDNGLGWGAGIYTPAAAGAVARFGTDTNRTLGYQPGSELFTPTLTGLESPARVLGLERRGVIAYLMAGLGYQPVKQFRFGASAGIGFASIYNKNMISTIGGTFTDPEVLNELHVDDFAIPRATVSFVATPVDSLDVVGSLAYQGDINASGYVDLTANGFMDAPLRNCYQPAGGRPGSHCRVDGVRLKIPNPTLEATAGLRYAQQRGTRKRVLDPMKDEVWDIEADVQWSQTSHIDEFVATVHTKEISDPSAPRIEFTNTDTPQLRPVPNVTRIPKHWNDSWTFRLGGDVNVVPERFTFRLGASFSPRAMPIGYANIDYAMPIQKIGIHVGSTLAVGKYRISVAYAHLFYETIDVPLGQGMVRDIVPGSGANADPVNEGRFAGSLDVVSLQANAQF